MQSRVGIAFIVGLSFLSYGADGGIPMVVATVASGAVIAGSSILNYALSGDTLINVNITVENWTKWPMTDPEVRLGAGVVDVLPRDIEPGTKELMVARKSRFVATGSWGTVSWKMENFRIVVMWSVPYDYLWYSNHLAVGSTVKRQPAGNSWFYYMYEGEPTDRLFNFVDREYDQYLGEIVYQNNGQALCEIHADMGSGHKTQVRVQVRPTREEDLAKNLKSAVDEMRRR